MKQFLPSLLCLVICGSICAQNNVGIGTGTPNPNAILHLESNDKGILIPRLTTAERSALGATIAQNEEGLLIYDEDLTKFYYWNGNAWLEIGPSSSSSDNDWAGAGSGYMHATNIQDLVGIGVDSALAKLHVRNFGSGGIGFSSVGRHLHLTSFDPNLTLHDLSSGTDNYGMHLNQSTLTIGKYLSSSNMLPNLVLRGSLVGIGTNQPTADLHVEGVNGLLATGELGQGGIPAQGRGVRMMWYPAKAAFRVGELSSSAWLWNADSIGHASMALGQDLLVKGEHAFSTGRNNRSLANGTFTAGSENSAFNVYATALGWGNDAEGAYSFTAGIENSTLASNSVAMGKLNIAEGQSSIALGAFNESTSPYSIALGRANHSQGQHSVSLGFDNQVMNEDAIAIGSKNRVYSRNGIAIGEGTQVHALLATSMGTYNIGGGDSSHWIGTDPLFEIGNGSFVARSNALTVLKNGNIAIGSTQPVNKLEIEGAIQIKSTFHQRSGTIRYHQGDFEGYNDTAWVSLTSGGTGSAAVWQTDGSDAFRVTGNVGVGTAQPLAKLHLADSSGVLFEGMLGQGQIPVEGEGTRMMWYPAKSAFRLGTIEGLAFNSYWNDDSVGVHSVAMGFNVKASGESAVALGELTSAVGDAAFAMGSTSNASGLASTALGWGSIASGAYSLSAGLQNTASGAHAFAQGSGNTASGISSVALGGLTRSTGDYALANGLSNSATGNHSFAHGRSIQAQGLHSAAIGANNLAHANYSFASGQHLAVFASHNTVFGRYNVGGGSLTDWVQTDPIFEIGNGGIGIDGVDRRNAVTVLKNGKVGVGPSNPQYRLDVAGAIRISTTDTSAAGVIRFNGNDFEGFVGTEWRSLTQSGTPWIDTTNGIYYTSGFVGIGTANLQAGLHVDDDYGILLEGDFGTNVISKEGAGTRMMWVPSKGAFRSGRLQGNAFGEPNFWNIDSIGNFSFATGSNTRATGAFSFASGVYSRAQGIGSVAMGWFARALGSNTYALGADAEVVGDNSIAIGMGQAVHGDASVLIGSSSISEEDFSIGIGNDNQLFASSAFAIGAENVHLADSSISIGFLNQADGASSLILGRDNRTADWGAIAIGSFNQAEGEISISIGAENSSEGIGATTIGCHNSASGLNSTALGKLTEAEGAYTTTLSVGTWGVAYGSTAIGMFNIGSGNPTIRTSGDPVLEIGNGRNLNQRANSHTFYNNGDVDIAGNLQSSSDSRLKEDIAPLGSVLSKIDAIESYTYRFKEEYNRSADRQIGLIAQEVQTQFPELVGEDLNGHLGLNYSNFSAILLQAVKELKTENEELKARIDRLEEER